MLKGSNSDAKHRSRSVDSHSDSRQAGNAGCHVRIDGVLCPWHRVTTSKHGITVYARGAAFLEDDYHAEEAFARFIAEKLSGLPPERAFSRVRELIPKLNGAWALIVCSEPGQVLAAVDRLRSVPLFYAFNEQGELVISPEVDKLADCVDAQSMNSLTSLELLLCGFVTGDETLFSGVHQLEPGEILHWANGHLTRTRHYRYLRDGWSDASADELALELEQVVHGVFDRLVKVLSGQRVIVPLSGGLDSRLVLALLTLHGHDNVVALHYGNSGTKEATIAKQVADALGVRWEFQPYEQGEWTTLMKSDEMNKFMHYAGQASSLPHLQDYLPLQKLKKNHPGLNTTILPGIVGDLLAGVWTPAQFVENEQALSVRAVCNWILYRKFRHWPCSRKAMRQMKHRVERFLNDTPFSSVHNCAAAFDLWEFENRAARYLINSVRAYEFHQLGWWLPLCDNELMDFFLKVPTPLREIRRLYAWWMQERFFTGRLARLAEIPPAGEGRWVWYGEPRTNPVGLRPALGRNLRRALKAADCWLPRPLKLMKLRMDVMRHKPSPLRFDERFACNDTDAARRTIGDLLHDPSGPLRGLPPFLAKTVAMYRDHPICLTQPLGLLAAVFLAEVHRR